MIDRNSDTKQLWQLLLSGKVGEVFPLFQDKMQQAPHLPENWSGMIACACAMGNIPTALQILDQRHTHFNDGPAVLLATMMGFASTRQEKILSFLNSNWPQERPDYVLVLYHFGHLLLELNKTESANNIFIQCKDLFLKNRNQLKVQENAEIFSTYRQCVNLIPFEEIKNLVQDHSNYKEFLLGDVTWLDDKIDQDKPIGLVAADKFYTETFGPDFFASLNQYWPKNHIFHLHIIDPDEQTPRLITEIRATCPDINLQVSSNSQPEGIKLEKSAYYASLRFFLLTSLLDRYEAPIITFDVDMIAKRDLKPIPDAVKDFNYIRFKRSNYGPGGYEYAALTAFQGYVGYEMADLTAKIIQKRIEESVSDLWFVDQTALYQAACYLTDNNNAFRTGSFYDSIPELDHFFHHLSAEEIKIKLSQRH